MDKDIVPKLIQVYGTATFMPPKSGPHYTKRIKVSANMYKHEEL